MYVIIANLKGGNKNKMKHLNRTELKIFVENNFKIYGNDIKKVSYIEYEDRIEYLINEQVLYQKNK